jgi:type II secretory pathway pseudopilin PulG
MRKGLIALIAIVSLASAGLLIAAPKNTNSAQRASTAGTVIDILGFTRQARDLPDHNYPTH